jgi:hypothetical protein
MAALVRATRGEEKIMSPKMFFALYRPHPGKDAELRQLIAEHVPTLRRLELITDREAVLVKAKDGTYLEICEWRTSNSSTQAHEHPEIAKIWEAMGKIADFPALEGLQEAKQRFPNFEPVNL